MTTHSDDFIRIRTRFFGELDFYLSELDMQWPPPQYIVMDEESKCIREATKDDIRDYLYHRVSISAISDEEITKATNVCRGAQYYCVVDLGIQGELPNTLQ